MSNKLYGISKRNRKRTLKNQSYKECYEWFNEDESYNYNDNNLEDKSSIAYNKVKQLMTHPYIQSVRTELIGGEKYVSTDFKKNFKFYDYNYKKGKNIFSFRSINQ